VTYSPSTSRAGRELLEQGTYSFLEDAMVERKQVLAAFSRVSP
jgi:hypothetical protein